MINFEGIHKSITCNITTAQYIDLCRLQDKIIKCIEDDYPMSDEDIAKYLEDIVPDIHL